jgi:hypothetical protein
MHVGPEGAHLAHLALNEAPQLIPHNDPENHVCDLR